MTCPECTGSRFSQDTVAVAQMYRNQPIVVRNVPAARCDQCGYLVISPETSQAIERVLTSGAVVDTTVAEVYDLSAPKRASKSSAVSVKGRPSQTV
jgi:YgiT-type zinc finger domain-containing protein